MRNWVKRGAFVVVIAAVLGAFAPHAEASSVCARTGLYLGPDTIILCVPVP